MEKHKRKMLKVQKKYKKKMAKAEQKLQKYKKKYFDMTKQDFNSVETYAPGQGCSNSCPIKHNQSMCATWGQKCPGISAGDTLCDKITSSAPRLDKQSLAFKNLKNAEQLLQPAIIPK